MQHLLGGTEKRIFLCHTSLAPFVSYATRGPSYLWGKFILFYWAFLYETSYTYVELSFKNNILFRQFFDFYPRFFILLF